VTANDEIPEDAHAMWIQYKGREWVVLHHGSAFTAYPGDNNPVHAKEVKGLYNYLKHEGFISPDDQPTINP
jgi:hypothetical protein